MKPDSENLSAQESLDLITNMIRQAKGNVERNGFYYLLWGWTILFCNLAIYVMLRFLKMDDPYWVWLLTIPAVIASMLYGRKRDRSGSSTHLDTVNMWLWICFGVFCFTIVAFGYKISFQIGAVITCVSAIPTFVSGIMLRFRPLIIGGICFWIIGMIIFLLPMQEQFLMAAVAIAIGYLVPGYMLKSRRD